MVRTGFDWSGVGALSVVAFILTSIAAFIRHVWWIIGVCMSGAPVTGGQVVLAIGGIALPHEMDLRGND